MSVKIYLMHNSSQFGAELDFNADKYDKEKAFDLLKTYLNSAYSSKRADKLITIVGTLSYRCCNGEHTIKYIRLIPASAVPNDSLRIYLINDTTVSIYSKSTNVWEGHVDAIPTWNALFKEENPALKIVTFNYFGGSEWGAKRIVKIKKKNSYEISGIDLEKNEERTYLLSKVKNLKEIYS